MRTIGLLGGTSWPSTIEYYKLINQLVSQRLGGFHSAQIILKSIDYHEIKSNYEANPHAIPELLRSELESLIAMGPDCLVICNHTLHKYFDLLQFDMKIPVFHALAITSASARQKFQKVLLVATKFTMEDGFFAQRLEQDGIQVVIPNPEERERIQKIQGDLAKGNVSQDAKLYLTDLTKKYQSFVDAVVLACTELPMALSEEDSALPVLNPMRLQCEAAVCFALSN